MSDGRRFNGGPREGAGRPPGTTKAAKLARIKEITEQASAGIDFTSEAGQILLLIDYRKQIEMIFRSRGNLSIKARLLSDLLDRAMGRPFIQQNPAAKKPDSTSKDVMEAIKKLVPQSGTSEPEEIGQDGRASYENPEQELPEAKVM